MANKRKAPIEYIKPSQAPLDTSNVQPRKKKAPQAGRTDISVALSVTKYSVRVYPGQYGLPPADGDYAGTDLAFVILEGTWTTDPPDLPVSAFFIHFVPDGLQFPNGGYSAPEQVVEVVMNWSQFEPLLTLLKTADSVQALYASSGGVGWADVEGQFTRS